jgi:hypothetical protein
MDIAAGGLTLYDDRDKGEFFETHHAGHRTRARGHRAAVEIEFAQGG